MLDPAFFPAVTQPVPFGLRAVLDLVYQIRQRHSVAQGAQEILKTVWIGHSAQIILIGGIDAIHALSLQFLPMLLGFRAVLDLAYQMRKRHPVVQGAQVILQVAWICCAPQVLFIKRINKRRVLSL